MKISVATVPVGEVDMLIQAVSGGSEKAFFEMLVKFGARITKILQSGCSVMSGTEFLGYHNIDMTLRGRLERKLDFNYSPWEKDVDLPVVPTQATLRKLLRKSGTGDVQSLLGRFLYWFWVAAQVEWMAYKLFVFDPRAGRADRFVFKPLEDAHMRFCF